MTLAQNSKVVTERMSTVVYGSLYTPNFIRFDTHVTREVISDPYYKYKFEIVVTNSSKSNGVPVTIYMTGVNMFANNFNISSQQYPTGFWVLIPANTPSVIYWYKTNDPNLLFTYTWTNIQFY